jgi:L-fuculokinase
LWKEPELINDVLEKGSYMYRDSVMVIDCGSTNITVSAFDASGNIIASASRPNAPSRQQGAEELTVWDMDIIWQKICQASKEVLAALETGTIRAVTVTTFGADGGFVDRTGDLVYPVISWQCTRTEETVGEIAELVPPRELYETTGYNIIRFNTLLRFLWMRKHTPEVFDRAEHWLMTPGLISLRLTGERSLDATSAGTMMSLDLKNRVWSDRLLALAGMDRTWFPRWVEPGDVIGKITGTASESTGIPAGVPVTASGHDTQFALFGSGAAEREAVLSTGTWEILLGRTRSFAPNDTGYENGLIFELDCLPGWWNPQLLMMGSGALEWVRKLLYVSGDQTLASYDTMIREAEQVRPGSGSVYFHPTFVPGTGPLQKYGIPGCITGMTVMTTRGDIYRAALEGLAFQLRRALDVMRESTGFSPEGLRVVGGGSKNRLWNRLRADITGLPVTITAQKEITALGAALFAFTGCGVFNSIEDARSHVNFSEVFIEPSPDRGAYEGKYQRFMAIPKALAGAYRNG